MYDKRFEYVMGEGFKDDGFYISPNDVVDLLYEQHERIQELERDIETICNDYEKSYGMDIRNAEWFTAW